MENLINLPEWLGTAVVGAVVAAIGYVAKLIVEWLAQVNEKRRARRARLAALYSLLRAGRVAVVIQAKHRDRLQALIEARDPMLVESTIAQGYDKVFETVYAGMTSEERVLHVMIRTITENTLHPINNLLLEWVRNDDYFKAHTWGRGNRKALADNLSLLEAHLVLWLAKYKVWIPEHPEHALVYMADEQDHGVGFPNRLQDAVEAVLKKGWLFGA
ncbi:MAG: hypothetical protein ACOYYU_11880 [Chloroflexota bacterium]